MADYRVEITDLAGTTKASDLFVTEVTISEVLNGPGAASFAIPLQHSHATADNLLPGAREVRVYRGTTKVFGGYLTAVSADVNARIIRCAAEGYFSRLRARLITTDQVFLATDQLNIAWNLIAHTQSASTLGITRGSNATSGVARDLVWCVEDAAFVGDAITDMAARDNGFDFWIDADKVWRTAYPRRGSSSGVTFNAGTNISHLRIDKDAGYLATRLIGYDETVNCVPQTTTTSDTTAISTYGLLHGTVSLTDLKSASDKSAKIAEELRLRKQPAVQATLTTTLIPWAANYDVGDTANLTASAGFANYSSAAFRVISHTTTVKGLKEETTVVLDSVTA